MKIIVKSTAGTLYDLSTKKTSVIIGRSSKCDLVVSDEGLSRQHAVIENTEEGLFITDTGSANGVFVDGKRIAPDKKTLINTFLQVSLANFSCEISLDDELDGDRENDWVPKPKETGSGTTTKSIQPAKFSSNQRASTNDKKEKGSKNSLIIPSVVGVVLLGGGWYFSHKNLQEKEALEKNAVTSAQAPPPVPEQFKTILDEPLSYNEYNKIALDSGKCEQVGELCKQMELDPSKFEGAVLKNNELYVFILPSLRYGNEEYLKAASFEDRDNMIGLYLLLKTDFTADFFNKKIAQMHLVIKNQRSEPTKVIRFHTKYFIQDGPERTRLLSNLHSALSGGPMEYRAMAKEVLKIEDL